MVDYTDSKDFREKVAFLNDVIEAHPDPDKMLVQVFSDFTREQAIAWGKAMGENEADSRQEVGDARDERVRRAMAYAAWTWDGRPEGTAHLKEFQIGTELTGSMDRAIFGRLLKKGKEK